jgi:PAS domain S-box-containing protein
VTIEPGELSALTTSAASLEDVVEELRTTTPYAGEVLAHMPVGTVVQAPSGEIVFGNEAAARILQLSMEQLTGRTSMDPSWRSIHPDGTPFPGDQHPAMQTLQTGAVVVAYMGVRTGDGPATWIHITSLPVRSGDGALLGAQTFFVDVTDEIEAEHRLRAEQERAERIARESTEVVAVCDADGMITGTTGPNMHSLGWGGDAVLGRHLGDCLHARPDVAAAFSRATSQPGGTERLTVAVPVAAATDGAVRHVEVRLRNRLDDPLLRCVVATLSDVDERVAAETELRIVNLDLERRLDELDRTHHLDSLLGQSANLLAGCRRVDEVADALWDLLDQAFPRSEVAVRLDSGTGAGLDVVRSRVPDGLPSPTESCWAVRTRQVHSGSTGGVHCDHPLPPGTSVCIPVVVDGRAIGSATVADDHWSADSLIITGEKIAGRIAQAIPAEAVEPRSRSHADG